MKPAERGQRFEDKVGDAFANLHSQFPDYLDLVPQFPVGLASGRRVYIDFKLLVRFAHENQNYYFELQSRNKHDHALCDKIESVRRDTPLCTFSFVHDAPLEASVANEMKARNVVCYDWAGFCHFVDGIELQLLQLRHAQQQSEGRGPSNNPRLAELINKLAKNQANKRTRELTGNFSGEDKHIVDDIIQEVARDPREAIRQARKLFGF